MRVGTFVVTVLFGIVMIVLANLAWMTAAGTTGPWYSSTIQITMYSTTLFASVLVAVGLSVAAMYRSAGLDATVRALETRIARTRGDVIKITSDAGQVREGAQSSADEEVQSILDDILGYTSDPLLKVEKASRDTLVGLPPGIHTEPTQRSALLLRVLRVQKAAVRMARNQVWTTVMGPLLMSIIFVGIASTMLLGVDYFAVVNYKVATALMLFLGFGWPILMGWAVVALAMMPSGRGRVAD